MPLTASVYRLWSHAHTLLSCSSLHRCRSVTLTFSAWCCLSFWHLQACSCMSSLSSLVCRAELLCHVTH